MLSHESLRQLPLLAIVALVARCAKRMREGFDLPADFPDRQRHLNAIDSAIRVAFAYANGAALPSNPAELANAANNVAAILPANMIGVPAQTAGMAVAVAQSIEEREKPDVILARASYATRQVGKLATAADADYRTLLDLGLGSFPDKGQPVDAGEAGPLGPLWPKEHG